jgi:hypothetical protein
VLRDSGFHSPRRKASLSLARAALRAVPAPCPAG